MIVEKYFILLLLHLKRKLCIRVKNFEIFQTNGFTVDTKTGQLTSITINKVNQKITQQFLYYNGTMGVNTADHRVSGAYAFEPQDDEALPITDNYISVKRAKGTLVDEVIQTINSEVTQIIRIYKSTDNSYIEFDWLVGDLQR